MEKASKEFLKSRFILVIIMIGVILILTGCGGKKEIDEQIFIMGVGVDVGTEEGTYLYTLQSALPKKGGGDAAELGDSTISIETSSLAFVGEKINESFGKVPFPGTVRVIVLGEDIARSGINEVIDYFQRYYQYRRTAFLLIAKGKAKDVLSTKLRSNKIPALGILSLIESQNLLTVSPVTRLGHYLTVLGREGQNPLIPIIEKVEPGENGYYYDDEKGKEIIINRAGIFEGGKMANILTDIETKGFLWLDDSVKTRYINAQAENGNEISGWITKAKTKYTVEEIAGKMGMKFKINVQISIREILGKQKEMDTKEWQQFLKELEPSFAKAIQEECDAAITRVKSTGLDFVGIGRKLQIKESKYWQQIKDNWQEELVDFPIAYDIKVNVDHGGLIRSSPTSIQEK